jgi:hypothetical protein
MSVLSTIGTILSFTSSIMLERTFSAASTAGAAVAVSGAAGTEAAAAAVAAAAGTTGAVGAAAGTGVVWRTTGFFFLD